MPQQPKKTVREITEAILEWESRYRVHRICYGKLKVWPLLRLQIVSALSSGVGLKKQQAELPKKKKKHRPDLLPHIERYPEAQPGGILFWAQASKFVQVEGRSFHRFFDPLLEFRGERRSDHTFWVWEDGKELPDASESGMTTVTPFLGALIEHARHSEPREKLNSSGRRFLEAWNATPDCPDIEEDALEQLCHQVSIWSAFFEHCFSENRPSAVFQTCYYAELTMALTLACQRQGIPCIELQHGQQGAWHSMYTHWKRVPRGGYELIPNLFWMWGEPAAANVRSWLRGSKRKVIVGGNPWLAWRAEKAEIAARLDDSAPSVKEEKRRTILISLQFTELPDFVWNTISERDDELWLLRMHPRFLSEEEAFLEDCHERISHENWEVAEASRADFYDLLPEVDVHVTGWSTTAFEALAFGVPTILIHPNGLDAMGVPVENGVFGYAEDATKLGELLDNPPVETEEEPTILADREQILAAWSEFS